MDLKKLVLGVSIPRYQNIDYFTSLILVLTAQLKYQILINKLVFDTRVISRYLWLVDELL